MSTATTVRGATRRPRRSVVTPRPRGLHVTTRGYLLVLLALVLLLLGAFAMGRSASSHATEQTAAAAVPALTQLTVQEGDTLWAIARRVAPQRDPRDVVAQIRRLNHLQTAAVQVGRQLLLPVAV